MNHIMIDLETLGTSPDAVILSIGAVRFDLDAGTVADPHGPDGFYTELDISDQMRCYGRSISASTLRWWMSQSAQAQQVFDDCDTVKETFYSALSNLRKWIVVGQDQGQMMVWSNGADFDLPMLVHAYDSLDAALPWLPYSGRCYRTYKNLPRARAVKVQRTGRHHNALDDAAYQARHLCAIHAELFGAAASPQGGAA